MTVLHSGSTKKFASGWENVFSGQTGRAGKSSPKPSTKKAGGKKAAGKKAAGKKSAGKKQSAAKKSKRR